MARARSRHRLNPAADLSRVIEEARHIADALKTPMHSAHLLLALLTVPNPAGLLLNEHRVRDDELVQKAEPGARESRAALGKLFEVAEQRALSADARELNTLHFLVGALKTPQSEAYKLLKSTVGSLNPLYRAAMELVTGVLPRRYQDTMRAVQRLPARPRRPRPPAVARVEDDWVVPRKTAVNTPADGPDTVVPTRAKPTATNLLSSVSDEAPLGDVGSASGSGEGAAERQHLHITMLPTELPPTALDLDPDQFPWLTSLGRNLTAAALRGELEAAVGRDDEIRQLVDILGKRRSNNPCLVGPPGVGKTAMVEGLAVKMAHMDPDVRPLHQKALVELDMGRIVAGTALRGSFAERMQGLKKDVERARGKVIVFIDEIHTLMGAGGSGDGGADAANELKAALSRGRFPVIGSTTTAEYRKHISADPAMERRFVQVKIDEPDEAATLQVLQGVAPSYAAHHEVDVSEDALHAAAQLSSRFITDARQPGKALDLLDLSLSRARRSGEIRLGRAGVARVCAELAKVPLDQVLLEDTERFLRMEQALGSNVVSHENVIGTIAETIRRNYAGFSSGRPMGSFLFLGPTGVGKTELAKALTRFLYGRDEAMLRFDMSEYSEAHSVARLVGAPPGYVGHDEGGQLTEAIRQRPHAVVLFDEIEKAHPDILPILLQVLDEGRLTDSRGDTMTFRNAVIVMTSNLGADAFEKKTGGRVGFTRSAAAADDARAQETAVKKAARQHFSPELWGRVEEKLVFFPLKKPALMQIADLLLTDSSSRLHASRNIAFEAMDDVLDALAEATLKTGEQGARPMRQLIQRTVEGPISDAILRGVVREGDRLMLHWHDDHAEPEVLSHAE